MIADLGNGWFLAWPKKTELVLFGQLRIFSILKSDWNSTISEIQQSLIIN